MGFQFQIALVRYSAPKENENKIKKEIQTWHVTPDVTSSLWSQNKA